MKMRSSYWTIISFFLLCPLLAVTADIKPQPITENIVPSVSVAPSAAVTIQNTFNIEEKSEEMIPKPEISYQGYIQPVNKILLHNSSQPPVNYGLLHLEFSSAFNENMQWFWRNDLYHNNSLKNFYFIRYEIRELYLDWFAENGDYRCGKQIITWGMADENNPMDNINPVDLYDPFQEKTDRKFGIWGIKSDHYFDDYTLTLVWLPSFKATRLPSTEYLDMPSTKELGDPKIPEERYIYTQYGARLLNRGQGLDWSISYYDGYEKIYSTIEYQTTATGLAPVKLGYHRSKVTGFDFAANIFELDVRGEAAYFHTEDSGGEDDQVRNPYYQYIIGASYKFENELKIGANYAQEVLTLIDNTAERELEEANLSRMGMQLSMFSPQAMVYILEKEFIDRHLKIKCTAINDLQNKGTAHMSEFSWEAADDLTYSFGLAVFGGSSDSLLGKVDDNDFGYLKSKYSF